jgi:undecaprenyl-diphosphatase
MNNNSIREFILKSRSMLSEVWIKRIIWLGVVLIFIAIFTEITLELFKNEWLPQLDIKIVDWIKNHRTVILNTIMVDLTALGSATIVALLSIICFVYLFIVNDRASAFQIIIASFGAGTLMKCIKTLVQRPRPDHSLRLIEASGFSYPSGHALVCAAMYLTLCLIGMRQIKSFKRQTALLAMTLIMVSLVAFSRVYLGVHYPSDILSGICIGFTWAIILEITLNYLKSGRIKT